MREEETRRGDHTKDVRVIEEAVQSIAHAPLHQLGLHRLKEEEENVLPVLFLDLDNTLYGAETGIADLMAQRITDFMEFRLGLSVREALELGHRYYKDYGLAVRGLLWHHRDVDPLEYDAFVDGGLPLDHLLQPNHKLIELLGRCQARLWIFTNAGLGHSLRVLNLLGLDHLFEGICYCDYQEPEFPAKPMPEAYKRAMRHAKVSHKATCYFVDDSVDNVNAARELGWKALHLNGNDLRVINEIADHWPELFKTTRLDETLL